MFMSWTARYSPNFSFRNGTGFLYDSIGESVPL